MITQDSDRVEPLYSYITYRETVLVHTDAQQRTPIVLERRDQTVNP